MPPLSQKGCLLLARLRQLRRFRGTAGHESKRLSPLPALLLLQQALPSAALGAKPMVATSNSASRPRSGGRRPRSPSKANQSQRLVFRSRKWAEQKCPLLLNATSARFASSCSTLRPQAAEPFPAPTSSTFCAPGSCGCLASSKCAFCRAEVPPGPGKLFEQGPPEATRGAQRRLLGSVDDHPTPHDI